MFAGPHASLDHVLLHEDVEDGADVVELVLEDDVLDLIRFDLET